MSKDKNVKIFRTPEADRTEDNDYYYICEADTLTLENNSKPTGNISNNWKITRLNNNTLEIQFPKYEEIGIYTNYPLFSAENFETVSNYDYGFSI